MSRICIAEIKRAYANSYSSIPYLQPPGSAFPLPCGREPVYALPSLSSPYFLSAADFLGNAVDTLAKDGLLAYHLHPYLNLSYPRLLTLLALAVLRPHSCVST